MDYKVLEKSGLNHSEATIYLTLLEVGSCRAGKIAKETGLNRTTIYKALESLIQKGLVSSVIKENTKYFEPSAPETLLQQLEKKEQSIKEDKRRIKEILPNLRGIYETNKEELEAQVFKGVKGLKTVFNDIVKALREGDEYLAFGVSAHAQIFFGYFEEFNETLKENKVKSKIIFDERAKENAESCIKHGYDVRRLSKEFMSPAEVNIYKKKVAIVLWHKTPLAIVMKGKNIADSFTQYFNLLWKIAK